MPEFFLTKMGQEFYDGTMKRIARALEKIAENGEKPLKAAPEAPKEPEHISKIIELSTAHITQEAAKVLDSLVERNEGFRLFSLEGEMHDFGVYPRGEYGWFIATPAEPMAQLRYASPDAAPLRSVMVALEYAQKQGCSWLLLDRDADETDNLPKYNW